MINLLWRFDTMLHDHVKERFACGGKQVQQAPAHVSAFFRRTQGKIRLLEGIALEVE